MVKVVSTFFSLGMSKNFRKSWDGEEGSKDLTNQDKVIQVKGAD